MLKDPRSTPKFRFNGQHLFFHEDNIKSVKGEEDETLYTSETDTWRWNDLTELKGASSDVVAKVEWHETSQDKVIFGHSTKKTKLGEFLQEVVVSDNERSVSLSSLPICNF